MAEPPHLSRALVKELVGTGDDEELEPSAGWLLTLEHPVHVDLEDDIASIDSNMIINEFRSSDDIWSWEELKTRLGLLIDLEMISLGMHPNIEMEIVNNSIHYKQRDTRGSDFPGEMVMSSMQLEDDDDSTLFLDTTILREIRPGSRPVKTLDILGRLRGLSVDFLPLPEDWLLAPLEADLSPIELVVDRRWKNHVSEGMMSPDLDFDRLGSMRAYVDLVRTISTYNIVGAITPAKPSNMEHRGPEKDAVVEDMWRRWRKRYQEVVGHALHMKPRSCTPDRLQSPGEEREAGLKARRARQSMNLQIFKQCRREQLEDLSQSMLRDFECPLRELQDLYVLFESQRVILLEGVQHRDDFVDDLEKRLRGLRSSVARNMGELDTEIEILEANLDLTAMSCRRFVTRMNRLAARDVQDRRKRLLESRQRLEHPAALGFVLRATEDIQTMRDVVRSTLRRADALQAALDGVSRFAVAAFSSVNDAVLFAEVDEGPRNLTYRY